MGLVVDSTRTYHLLIANAVWRNLRSVDHEQRGYRQSHSKHRQKCSTSENVQAKHLPTNKSHCAIELMLNELEVL